MFILYWGNFDYPCYCKVFNYKVAAKLNAYFWLACGYQVWMIEV